jgi:adenylate kinase family enzyme
MRIMLVGRPHADTAAQGRMLAERLGVPHLVVDAAPGTTAAFTERELAPHAAGFVLEGFPRDLAEASALDDVLGRRAAEIEVALYLRSAGSAPTAAEEALLEHYRRQVVELRVEGAAEELHERVLAALREALVAA